MKASTERSRSRSLLLRLGFIASLVLFLCSLLTVLSAPTSALWILAIVVEEWGHYGVLLSLVLAALVWRRERIGNLAAGFALLAAIFFLLPSLQALRFNSSLPEKCDRAFGRPTDENTDRSPFSLARLFRPLAIGGVAVEERVYANDGSKQLKLDIYRSNRATGALPLIVMIHGGSWNGGGKAQLTTINRWLAQKGYAVAAINYRHAPKWTFPAAVDDVFRAIDFLKANAAELHLDPARIVLIGRSAGAQIALSAAYAGREPGIRGVVDFYGPADLVLGYNVPSRRYVLDSQKVLREYLGGAPSEKPEIYAAASPINFVNANTPPTLLIHGRLDPIVWPMQSRVLAARLQEAGRPYLLLELPWATHGCDANLAGPSGQLSLYAIERFLTSVFASPALL